MINTNNSITIDVETCHDCHLHQWCSQHNERKYQEYYNNLKSRVEQIFQQVQIRHNFIPSHFKKLKGKSNTGENRYLDIKNNNIIFFPRFGSFQISVNGNTIYSKIKSNLWPCIQRIIKIIDKIAISGNPSKYQLQYRLNNDQNVDFVKTYKAQIERRITPKKKSFSIQRMPKSSNRRFIIQKSQYTSYGNRSCSPEQLITPRIMEEMKINHKRSRKELFTKSASRQENAYDMFLKQESGLSKNKSKQIKLRINEWKINNKKNALFKKYKCNVNFTRDKVSTIHKDKNQQKNKTYLKKQTEIDNHINLKVLQELHRQDTNIESKYIKKQQMKKRIEQIQSKQQINGWSQKQGSSQFLKCVSERSYQKQKQQDQIQQNSIDNQTFSLKKKISIDDNLQIKQTFLQDAPIQERNKQSQQHLVNESEAKCSKIISQLVKNDENFKIQKNQVEEQQQMKRTIKQEDIFSEIGSTKQKNGKMFQTTKSQFQNTPYNFVKKRFVMIWQALAIQNQNGISFDLIQKKVQNLENQKCIYKEQRNQAKRRIKFVESQTQDKVEQKDPFDPLQSQNTQRLLNSQCQPIFTKKQNMAKIQKGNAHNYSLQDDCNNHQQGRLPNFKIQQNNKNRGSI